MITRKVCVLPQATGAQFIQVDHITGDFVGCQSVDPEHLLACRNKYSSIVIFGGIHPKYYRLKELSTPITESAAKAEILADAVVVTGEYTGGETSLKDLRLVKKAIVDHPLIAGSGVNVRNVRAQLIITDGAIVGTAFKKKGVQPGEPPDVELVEKFMGEVEKVRNF